MKITFLGTGTSTGVPQIGCKCPVCRSKDPKDNRLRCSSLIETGGLRLLIDCTPDFRQQALRAEIPSIDAVLVTHTHYDHVGGFDDMRPYCFGNPMPVYARPEVLSDLRKRIPYCFGDHLYPGVPTFKLNEIGDQPFSISGTTVTPLPVWHGKMLINGYRIGDLAYITDAKTIDGSTISLMRGVDTLVLNALRLNSHPTHLSLDEALGIISRINPRQAYLIHASHQIGLHAEVQKSLPDGVTQAYDGLSVTI